MAGLNKKQIGKDLLGIAKESLDSYLDVMKEEGADAAAKGKKFADMATALTEDLVAGVITRDQYLDALENIRLAMDSYLLAKGYKQSRKHLKILIKVLKNVAKIAISVVAAVV